MISTDKKDFSDSMISCFQNYRANISKQLIDEWFEELMGFSFFHVRQAFRKYTNENEKYPPTRAAIINLAKKNTIFKLDEDSKNLGCVNLISGAQCGKEIEMHKHCKKCYEAKRPKNEVDLLFDKPLAEFYAEANSKGFFSERDCANYAREKMGMLSLGKQILSILKNNEKNAQDAF